MTGFFQGQLTPNLDLLPMHPRILVHLVYIKANGQAFTNLSSPEGVGGLVDRLVSKTGFEPSTPRASQA